MSIFNFKPIATALSPNTEKDDIALAFKLLLPQNWAKWREGSSIFLLENKFREFFNAKYAKSFSAGRAGLLGILKSLPSDGRNEIITQAFTTIAIPNAIKWAGFKTVYTDINENTYNINADKIEEKINPKTKAIIIQHTFGIPADIDKVLAICKKYKLFLIEDCAHSLGAEFNGKKIGTFGDASFFSFGRDKIISSTSGGVVITNNDAIAEKLNQFQASLSYPSKKWILQQLLHPIIFAISLPIYHLFNLGKIKIILDQKIGLIARAYNIKEKMGLQIEYYKFPNVLAIMVLKQFEKLERFNLHRAKLSLFYKKEFTGSQINIPKISVQKKPTLLYYTIQIKNRDKILRIAQKNHIILGDWFHGALGPRGVDPSLFGYKKGDCPIAEKVGSHVLNLPTNINTNENDAYILANFIKKNID